jgi:beta-glucosidase
VYVRAPESVVRRPDRELVGFAKVELDPGERQVVRVPLGAAAFRYWDTDTHAWRSDPGRYEVLVGTSSHDIRASTEIRWGDLSTA